MVTVLIFLTVATQASEPIKPQREPITVLTIVGKEFTDADLANIVALDRIERIQLDNTSITFAAVDCLVEAHPKLRCYTALSETLYEAYLRSYKDDRVGLAPVLCAYDEALGWKLGIAPFKQGKPAERRAHEQYLRYVEEIRQIQSSKSSSVIFPFEMALADCAAARGKMRLAVCQGKTVDAIAQGRAAQPVAEQLPTLAWKTFLDDRVSIADVIVAFRTSKDIRIHVAQLNNDRRAERQVRESIIVGCRAAVRELFKRYGTEPPSERFEILALAATLLSAEEASLSRFDGAETPQTWQRARRRAYFATHVSYAASADYWPQVTAIQLTRDLATGIDVADAKAHSDAAAIKKLELEHTATVEHFAFKIHALYKVGAAYGTHGSWSFLACKMMRCRLRDRGESVYRMKQGDFQQMVESPGGRSGDDTYTPSPPFVDWAHELTPDEQGQ